MNAHDRDLDILDSILMYCSQTEEALVFFGDSFEAFRSNSVFHNAVFMCLLQIGEISGRLSEEFRSTHPEIPWRAVKAFRNVIAHDYGAADPGIAWDIIHDDIPALRSFCAASLSASSSEESGETE